MPPGGGPMPGWWCPEDGGPIGDPMWCMLPGGPMPGLPGGMLGGPELGPLPEHKTVQR